MPTPPDLPLSGEEGSALPLIRGSWSGFGVAVSGRVDKALARIHHQPSFIGGNATPFDSAQDMLFPPL